jgi:cephalosporin hydroxylase
MNKVLKFFSERKSDISKMYSDKKFFLLSIKWIKESIKYKYNYNFTWMGRPIIKYPNDMVVIQEIFWKVKPDLVIETGIAHGGSIIFSASLLKMMGIKKFKVIGIDIDIRKHNLKEILKHPMKKHLKLIEGSSVDKKIFNKIKSYAKNYKKILVILDSNHIHNHVLEELNIYSNLVSKNSYIILPDTYIEYLPNGTFPNRPWGKGNNPLSALKVFLKNNQKFKIDKFYSKKAMISEAFNGFIKKIK